MLWIPLQFHYIYTIPIISTPFPLYLHHSHIYIIPIISTPFPLNLHHSHCIYTIPISTSFPLNLHHSRCTCIYTIPSPNRIHYSRTVLSNNIKCYHIQYMYVPFQQWNCSGIVPFQANHSHSLDSISCQFIIPHQFTLKVENSSNSKISIPMPWFLHVQPL